MVIFHTPNMSGGLSRWKGAAASSITTARVKCSISPKHLQVEYCITQEVYLPEEIYLQIIGGISESWILPKQYREKLADVFN